MPPRRRRRRRSTDHRRPPLIFTESPVNITHGIPSPALCANHPPTADVVPVLDATMHWVGYSTLMATATKHYGFYSFLPPGVTTIQQH